MTFGEYLKYRRFERCIDLAQLIFATGFAWDKVEKGEIPPPVGNEIHKTMKDYLNILPGTQENFVYDLLLEEACRTMTEKQ